MRHPSLIPRNPPPQPLPPANKDTIPTAFPLQSSQFFGNPQPTVNWPLSNGISGAGVSFADGPYRNLFKREKDSPGSESASEELADSGLEVTEKANEATEGEHPDEKVRTRFKLYLRTVP